MLDELGFGPVSSSGVFKCEVDRGKPRGQCVCVCVCFPLVGVFRFCCKAVFFVGG